MSMKQYEAEQLADAIELQYFKKNSGGLRDSVMHVLMPMITDDAPATRANLGDVAQALQILAAVQGLTGQGENVLFQVAQVFGQIQALKSALEAQIEGIGEAWSQSIEQNGRIFAELQRIKRELVKLSKPPTKNATEGSKILGASGDWAGPDAGGEIIRDEE